MAHWRRARNFITTSDTRTDTTIIVVIVLGAATLTMLIAAGYALAA